MNFENHYMCTYIKKEERGAQWRSTQSTSSSCCSHIIRIRMGHRFWQVASFNLWSITFILTPCFRSLQLSFPVVGGGRHVRGDLRRGRPKILFVTHCFHTADSGQFFLRCLPRRPITFRRRAWRARRQSGRQGPRWQRLPFLQRQWLQLRTPRRLAA